jgi:hypothetical protein
MGCKPEGVTTGRPESWPTFLMLSQKLCIRGGRLGGPAEDGRGSSFPFPLVSGRLRGSTSSLSGEGRAKGRTVCPEDAHRIVAAASIAAGLGDGCLSGSVINDEDGSN